jgi:serine/threonine protein kinase/TolA-binding protein
MTTFQPVRFGKYDLLERIGLGPTAELFRARRADIGDEEKTILIRKILPQFSADQAFVASMKEAARISTLLHHPNIVPILDFGDVDDTWYIATEYLPGRTLQEVLVASKENEKPLELPCALYITAEICKGLQYAHSQVDPRSGSQGIIHTNISPQSILVTSSGNVKISEFGVNSSQGQGNRFQMGMFRGKVAYMSPEQLDGKPVDCRSDLFSLGIILYETTTGRRAFDGETVQVFSQVRQARFEPPENIVEGLAPEVCQIISRALEKNPGNRYPSASEILTGLEEILAEVVPRPNASTLLQYMESLFIEDPCSRQQRISDSVVQEADKCAHDDSFSKEHGVSGEGDYIDRQASIGISNADIANAAKKMGDIPFGSGKTPTEIRTENVSGQQTTIQPTSGRPIGPPDKNMLQHHRRNSPMLAACAGSDKSAGMPTGKKVAQDRDNPISNCEARGSASAHPLDMVNTSVDTSPRQETNATKGGVEPTPSTRRLALWSAVAATVVIAFVGFALVSNMKRQWSAKGSTVVEPPKIGEGVKALKAGLFDKAIDLFDEVLAVEPAMLQRVSKPYAEALEGQAAALNKTDLKKAEELLVQAAKFNPESVSAYTQLGLVYLRQKDFGNAARSYETVIQLGEKSADTFFNLGYVYAVQEDYAKAENMYAQVVQMDPPFLDEALFNLAMVQDRLGKRNQSVKNLRLAVQTNPKNTQAKHYLNSLGK